MKKKAAILVFLLVAASAAMCLGVSNARYYSSVTVTKSIDFVRTVGAISVDEVQENEGYDRNDGSFLIDEFNSAGDIDFIVSNTVFKNGVTYANDENFEYYIRIPSALVSCTVIKEEKEDGTIVPEEGNATDGFGPFVSESGEAKEYTHKMRLDWKGENIFAPQTVTVQIVKKAAAGVRVISETDVKLRLSENVKIILNYYEADTWPAVPVKEGNGNFVRYVTFKRGAAITVDFKDEESIKTHGIEFPTGYPYAYAVSGLTGWSNRVDSVPVCEKDAGAVIEVYCYPAYVNINFAYRDRSQPVDAAYPNNFQIVEGFGDVLQLQIPKGATLDFANGTNLPEELGSKIPSGYKFVAAHCDAYDKWGYSTYFSDVYTVPADTTISNTNISVYVAPIGQYTITVKLERQKCVSGTGPIGPIYDLGTQDITFDANGKVTLNFAALASYGALASYVQNGTFVGKTFSVCVAHGDNYLQIETLMDSADSAPVDYYRIYGSTISADGYCLANNKKISLCIRMLDWS